MQEDAQLAQAVKPSLSPSGAAVWCLNPDYSITLLKPLRPNGQQSSCTKVVFSPDGGKIAAVSGACRVQIWDAQTAEIMGPALPTAGYFETLAFSADGNFLVCASTDQVIKIWDIAVVLRSSTWVCREERYRTPWGGWDGWVYSSDDNRRLFRIPEHFRQGFIWSHGQRVFGAPETIVDIRDYVHGEDWERCYNTI